MLFVLRGVLVLPAGSLFKGCVTFSTIKHLAQITAALTDLITADPEPQKSRP